jgi:flavodoxin
MESTDGSLVAYYSRTGNTERIARDLAQRLGASLESIIDSEETG